MQEIIQWEKSVSAYRSEFENLKLEKTKKCKCGCTRFYKWGKYARFVVDENRDYPILIKRIRCIKCGATYSFLPSFCVPRLCFSVDFIMLFLKVLILKLKSELGYMKRQAYKFLKRFTESESLLVTFLRTKGVDYLPEDKKKRRKKIFESLLKLHKSQKLISCFFRETGRYFMAKNESKNIYLSR